MYEIKETDCEYIKKVKNEFNMTLKEHPEYENHLNDMLNIILNFFKDKDVQYEDFVYFKSVIYKLNTYNALGRAASIRLSNEFFETVKLGLSQHKRDSRVKWDLQGYYYEGAYDIKVIEFIDVFTGSLIETELIDNYQNLHNDDKRIYMIVGGQLTNIYFDKAYIFRGDYAGEREKCFVCVKPFELECKAFLYKNKYILAAYFSDKVMMSIRKKYILDVQIDNDEILSDYGITYKQNAYELFGKRKTLRF